MSKIQEFLKKCGIKLGVTAKAGKLMAQGASDTDVAVAIRTTKAYKENAELRKLCSEIISEAGKQQSEEAAKKETRSTSNKGGEYERY